MIEILPMSDKDREAKLLESIGAKEENARILAMTEGGSLLGWVAVDILDDTLRMLRFHLEDEASPAEYDFYMDTLMRAAASYGEVNKAGKLATVTGEYNGFLIKRGFEADASHAFAPMSLIVHYTNPFI